MRMHTMMIAAAAISAACLTTEDAMAAPTTWVYTNPNDRPVISHDNVYIRLWVPEPELYAKDGPGAFPYDSISMYVEDGENLFAAIYGNSWEGVFPPPSPSLYVPGGLSIENVLLEGHGTDAWQYWNRAHFNPSTGYTQGAELYQAGPEGDFDLTQFAYDDGQYAYIGFGNYLLDRYGYLQIERASAADITQWRLVGYAYGEVGESVVVVDLTVVPPAPSGALLMLAGAVNGRPTRRKSS
ncbi:MAG: hypothetical protein KF912_00540 [Phycisphaeraceae bacterium]|nr:hypothetical protein [Phycisphaeraceae bacterium]MBX3365786.1 hypothetical protein [Phycisphaeraceae bacterium]